METVKIVQFDQREIKRAHAHAEAGGVALLLTEHAVLDGPGVPACFKKATKRGYLFCADPKALRALAGQLGVRRIVIDRMGRVGQHVDLVGRPLWRALENAVPDREGTDAGDGATGACPDG